MFKLLTTYISARIFLWVSKRRKGYTMLIHMRKTIEHANALNFSWMQDES